MQDKPADERADERAALERRPGKGEFTIVPLRLIVPLKAKLYQRSTVATDDRLRPVMCKLSEITLTRADRSLTSRTHSSWRGCPWLLTVVSHVRLALAVLTLAAFLFQLGPATSPHYM